jgi:opacity protein-like surface antigen
MRRLALFAAVAVALSASPARAQSWELGATAGFTPAVDLERHAPEVDTVSLAGGPTWTFQAARFFMPGLGVEVLWSEQPSSVDVTTPGGEAELYAIATSHLHGNLVYQFNAAGSKLQPFIFGGVGATFFRADDVPSETKFSWGFGGGAKVFPWPSIGFRGHVRFNRTALDDEGSGDFCLPFGFCQGSLSQLELAGGVVVRF